MAEQQDLRELIERLRDEVEALPNDEIGRAHV